MLIWKGTREEEPWSCGCRLNEERRRRRRSRAKDGLLIGLCLLTRQRIRGSGRFDNADWRRE